jgi:hypothetical protein
MDGACPPESSKIWEQARWLFAAQLASPSPCGVDVDFSKRVLLQAGSDFTLEEEGVLYFPLWSSGDKMTGYFGFEKAIIPGF